jgi:ABC-type multidrug transport system fused ATPase/permease subunit
VYSKSFDCKVRLTYVTLDHRTDEVIQRSLSTEFQDCTLLTVAHRLQTIMNSDKILVLDDGKLVEFAPPKELLRKEDSLFKKLVDESADRAVLYDLADIDA